MATKNDHKVHLDHLIPRESLRWVDSNQDNKGYLPSKRDPLRRLLFKELTNREELMPIFPLLRKPDFQHETSAWTPDFCLALLESIVKGLIIPSLIIWKSPDNNFLYILDGAHRISVMRAWILDDWGDKAPDDYYERHEYQDEIRSAAQAVRDLVKMHIGSYEDFVTVGNKYIAEIRQGGQVNKFSDKELKRGAFFLDMIQEAGFYVQEVPGDYEIAEASFLRINRSGQPLDDWETTLIENRNSSLARAVMSVAKGGSGRYWPERVENVALKASLQSILEASIDLHRKIFVPLLKTPINDANVPFIATTKYFPKQAYLIELLPISMNIDDVNEMFARDRDAEPETVVRNGYELLERSRITFGHLTGDSNTPLSLAIVPLFYFYTDIGRYVRSCLYGFITWLMSGNDEAIRIRKVIFSTHRGRFEQVLYSNDIAGAITRRFGSGPRATPATVQFYQKLLELLVEDASPIETATFQSKLSKIMSELTTPSQRQSETRGRTFTSSQRTKINLRELFKSAIRCEICAGVLDLKMGVQYDHTVRFANSRHTDPSEGRPTHPFCNNQRDAIEAYRGGQSQLHLPTVLGAESSKRHGYQLSLLDLFTRTTFPDDPEEETRVGDETDPSIGE